MTENPLRAVVPDKIAHKCPYCGSLQVRPSSRLSSAKTHRRYRCEVCKRHFKSVPIRLRAGILAAIVLLPITLIAFGLYLGHAPEVKYQPQLDLQQQDVLAKKIEAAKGGDTQAQYELGNAYWKLGQYQDALPWIETAAGGGHVDAEFLLGTAYLSGRGTLQNYRAALEHFKIAARHGHLEAQYQLGLLYREGLAAPRNKESAYLWLNIAAARGHEDALAERDRLGLNMTTEQINRAQEESARESIKISATAPEAAPEEAPDGATSPQDPPGNLQP